MMDTLERIFHSARAADKRIVLAEGNDARIQQAAVLASIERLARIILLGNPGKIMPVLDATGADMDRITIIDPQAAPDLDELAAAYHELRAHKGMTMQAARAEITNPLVQAAMRVRTGGADGTVAGAVATTADTVRAALQIIGRARDASQVSSFFLMAPGDGHHSVDDAMIFADCGLVVDPSAPQLAAIALSSAQSCAQLLGEEPRVVLLSFSTAGSAEHAHVDKVREALAIVRDKAPDLHVDGELQFDAAFDIGIRSQKAPGSTLSGRPNVYVFPDLNSGNIGYKIAQRIGGLNAVGPILQGLAKPANDLSRGCSVDDVRAAIAVTALQA